MEYDKHFTVMYKKEKVVECWVDNKNKRAEFRRYTNEVYKLPVQLFGIHSDKQITYERVIFFIECRTVPKNRINIRHHHLIMDGMKVYMKL